MALLVNCLPMAPEASNADVPVPVVFSPTGSPFVLVASWRVSSAKSAKGLPAEAPESRVFFD